MALSIAASGETLNGLQIRHNFINCFSQFVLPGNDAGNLGVEFCNINHLAGVFLRHIGGDRDVVFVFPNGFIVDQRGKMLDVRACSKRLQYPGAIFIGEFVFVAPANKFGGGVYKEGFVVLLALFEHDNAGCDCDPGP